MAPAEQGCSFSSTLRRCMHRMFYWIGFARQHKAGFTSVDIFDEAAVNKRNKRLLGPLEQVLVIGAYFYDLGSEKRERKRRR